MDAWRKWWLGFCAAVVMGQGSVDYYGYAPGTCTDQQAPPRAGAPSMTPCEKQQSSDSIRSRRYRRSHGGK
jgi:hypothetical protein